MQISYADGKICVHDIQFDPWLTLIDSAQVFHWKNCGIGCFEAVVENRYIKLTALEDGFELEYAEQSDISFWRRYFDLDRDYGQILSGLEALPAAKRAVELLPGLRVLNQPVWEVLLTFILSANNNVSRIRQLVEKMMTSFDTDGRFPTPAQLSEIGETALREIGCGYRAPYLIGTAEMVRDGFPLESLKEMSYEEAHRELIRLPGVGDKVADCIQLFGLGHGEAFPVDVWVERLMKTWFLPDAHGKREIRRRAHDLFGANAGIIQQYLFHCARLGLIPLEE